MKFLLVDDEVGFVKSLRDIVESIGHAADCAFSAEEGVALVAKVEYDFLLVDYCMPEKSGIWFMKNAVVPRSTKVLLMTAYLDRKVIGEMLRLGASGYLVKPFDREELARHIGFHTEDRRVRRSNAQP